MTRYVVIGAGAVGCAIGGLLARAGAHVAFVARGAGCEALRRDGVHVVTPQTSFVVRVDVLDGAPAPGDVVLLCVQSQHSAEALAVVRERGLAVVCMQNGVATERIAAQSFARVYGAMVWSPLASPQRGCVRIYSEPPHGVVDVGCYPAGVDPLVETVTRDLRAAGFDARPDPQILRTKYGKLLVSVGNAVEALAGPKARGSPLSDRVIAEALRCFAAAGIDYLPLEELLARVQSVKSLPIDGLHRSGGSMWQSLDRGAGSVESAFLNGEIVALGERHGIPTPLNRGLVTLSERAAREGWSPGSVADLERSLG
ncbi:MAG TPA: 2-dehydropantoate 2-reductase N-terminal domain-containing protein [Polyangiaceae bacterium]|nr:2-dehydropantoate 2-reductase N-terminal domain-containing protein [Polyangiaceae bacterium]